MMKSPLYNYYMEKESSMMMNIYRDKNCNGYKSSSAKMFKIEVDIITHAIKQLNAEGIIVGYIYDALFCSPTNQDRVLQVMNEVVLNHKVYTTAK